MIKGKIKRLINKSFANRSDKILDLGCGSNPYYQEDIEGKIFCLDINKTSKTHLVSDADKLPFRPNSFDKVVSVNSFYYFKNPFNVVKSVHNILKKDGKLILIVPFFYPIHDAPDDKYRFTEYGLRTLLENDFRIERIETIGGIFNLPAVMLHSLIKGIPLLFPKEIRKFIQILTYILWPFYIIAQLFSILDVLDITRRFPTYYFVVAKKK
ncbi:MAG: class I SAM-dependent methyltransferase [Nanoarchaeota archaeon]